MFTKRQFALNAGELLLIEGANGSGKTSLLRGIAGLLDFETGCVNWNGRPTVEDGQAFRADLSFLSHKSGLKADLNLVENLRFDAGLHASDKALWNEVLERLDLVRLQALPIRVLSAGQQRRVALARVLLSVARIWMMDEPFTNLDRSGRELVKDLLLAHVDGGGAAIVASHQDVNIAAPIKRINLS